MLHRSIPTWPIHRRFAAFPSIPGPFCWRLPRRCWSVSGSEIRSLVTVIARKRKTHGQPRHPNIRPSDKATRLHRQPAPPASYREFCCSPSWAMRANSLSNSSPHYGKAHHLVLPNIEYVLWAILIGLAISNTVGVPAIFRSGVATYEFWLKAGIVLLGARFLLGDVRRLGGLSLVLIAIELALALTFMTYLGRAFKLKPKLVSLLAVGSSICGVSAIIAAQGAIDADEEDSSYAIAAILAAGSDLAVSLSAGGTLRCT